MGKFLIGLFLGVAVAGGVVYYLNSAPMKFVSKMSGESSVPSNDNNPVMLQPGTKIQEAGVSNDGNQNASESKYDFYQILQDKNASDNNNQNTNQAGESKVTRDIFYVQAGAFTDASAANSMKAQLALQGYEAKIKITKSNGEPISLVVLGPFTSIDDVNYVRQELKNNGIETAVFKVK